MHRVPAVVISSDSALVADLKRCGEDSGAMELALEFGIPYRELTRPQVEKIRSVAPRFAFLDLDDDPATGVKVARYLADASSGTTIIALGTSVSSQALVAAMRAGVSEYLEKPLSPAALEDALERLSRKSAGSAREVPAQGGKVLLFLGAKGGAGSTTIAANLATRLHLQTGERVVVVDLDLRLGDVALHLGIEPRYGVVDLAKNLHRLDEELLGSYIAQHATGLHALCAPFDPEDGRAVGAAEVQRIVGILRGVYDWVVLDASSSFDAVAIAGMHAADEIFLVTQLDVSSLRNIQRIRRVLKRVVPTRTPSIVVNRFHSAVEITLKDVERTLGLPVFGTLSNDYGSVARAINAGEPVVLDAAATCREDLAALAAEIGGVEAEPERRTRWHWKLPSLKRREAGSAGRAAVLAGAEP